MTNERQLRDRLQSLLAARTEREWVEFKENNSKPEEIGEYISSLSNAAALQEQRAGYLVWGIQDATHRIVGTTFRPREEKIGNEELENWLARLLEPRINFRIHELSYDSGPVVMFEIPPCEHMPVKWKDTAFIRVGSYKKKLKDYPEKERELWLRSSRISFEKGIAAHGLSAETVLAALDYPAFFEMSSQAVPLSRDGILEKLQQERMIVGLCADHWDVTNLGGLLFARKLADFQSLVRKAVRVIVYRGKDRTETTKEQLGVKGYASGFEGLISFVNDQLPSNEEIGAVFRNEVRMYPEIAVRELLANAIVHQDLSITGTGPTVEVFTDRVEITNPGSPLIEPLRFIDEPPRSRNEDTASLLRRLKICEERGSGIDKVIFNIELFQLPAPEFRVTNNSVIATLFSARKLTEMDRADKIRACYQHACLRFVSRETMTNASFRKRLGIEDQNYATASRIIADAIDAGLVKPRDPDNTSRKHASYVPYWA
jgi:predicted HTH transcriptional regulator